MADVDELARRFATGGSDSWSRSPLYVGITLGIARDRDIVSLLSAAPDEQQLPVLLLAAVHSIVLAEPDLELAQWYPTTADRPRTSDPFPAFARLCAERGDEIREIVATHSVQTNEVGRCALVLPGLAAVAADAGPIALIDVGTSAGLHLLLDRYEYHYEPRPPLGAPSDVRVPCATRGVVAVPAAMPPIAGRVGLDRSPIDVSDPEAARWLTACVWPDQTDRFVRLRAAIELARSDAPEIHAGDVFELVPDLVRAASVDGHPVVMNAWMLNYLSADDQRRYVELLGTLGGEVDMSWVYAESPGQCPGLPFPEHLHGVHTTALMVVSWRGGQATTDHLGTAHPHGYWWEAPPPAERQPSG